MLIMEALESVAHISAQGIFRSSTVAQISSHLHTYKKIRPIWVNLSSLRLLHLDGRLTPEKSPAKCRRVSSDLIDQIFNQPVN